VVLTAEEFAAEAGSLLVDRTHLESLGEKASGFIRGSCGAALRCLGLIEKYIYDGKA
jgi:hypothetical protein